MITVNELFRLWLHNQNPQAALKVWSKETADYIFETDKADEYSISIEIVENMKVECFYSYYDKKKCMDVFIVNVE